MMEITKTRTLVRHHVRFRVILLFRLHHDLSHDDRVLSDEICFKLLHVMGPIFVKKKHSVFNDVLHPHVEIQLSIHENNVMMET
jgi:hypothetical protein